MTEMPRIDLIDYLRGLAALSVAWFHITLSMGNGLEAAGRYGFLGVDAFFVISGLVVPYSILRAFPEYSLRDFPTFVLRRMLRLEPPYIVSLLLVLALPFVAVLSPSFGGAPATLPEPSRIAAHLFYLIPLTDHKWLQPVYWTLAWEFAFYLSIGLIFPNIARTEGWHWFVTLTGICTILVTFLDWPARMLLFIMGIQVYRTTILGDSVWRNLLVPAVCLAVMSSAGAQLEGLVGFIVAMMLSNHSLIPSLPSIIGRPLSALGLVSYSLYLFHVPVSQRFINLGKQFIDSKIEHYALALVALVVCLIVAIVIYIFVERVSQKFARGVSFHWFGRRPKATLTE